MSTNLQDYIELLTAEQHVQVDKLRESARNGVSPLVRGEVWLYLLGVLSSDKTSEMTLLKTLRAEYASLPSNLPSQLTSLVLQSALAHHTRRFESPTYESLITSLTAESLPPWGATGPPSTGGGLLGAVAGQSKPHTHAQGVQSMAAEIHSSHAAHNGHGQRPTLSPLNHTRIDSMDSLDGDMSFRATSANGFLVPAPTAPPTRHAFLACIEEVLGKYWHATGQWPAEGDPAAEVDGDVEPRPMWRQGEPPAPVDWVYLATPFVCCLSRSATVFFAFEKLMERMKSFPPLPSRVGSMLGLFRLALPELHAFFEDEQVPMITVAMSWMTTLLAREMWLGDVLRLWDSYFAVSAEEMFALHCYVCVAILATCKETLEELDGSEAKLMLLDLPPMDVDRLLHDAANLKVQFTLPGPIDDE